MSTRFGTAVAVTLLLGASSWAATTRYVDPAGTCGGNSPCTTTIGGAIRPSGSGDPINGVACSSSATITTRPGTASPRTLQGPQAGVNACGRVASEAVVSASPGTSPTILINGTIASTLTIDGFTFRGSSNGTG